MNSDLFIDFASEHNNYRRLHGGGRGQPVARAIGLATYKLPLYVIDATAGLGQDAFVLASLGCRVSLIERVDLIANKLQDALQRGAMTKELQEIIARMELVRGDAKEQLLALAAIEQPDVVYLDPMFPPRNKSSLVKKEMRILKELVGGDEDADQLLNIARQIAKRRVVVKRPRHAPFLQQITPHASQEGKANRFDIYMPL